MKNISTFDGEHWVCVGVRGVEVFAPCFHLTAEVQKGQNLRWVYTGSFVAEWECNSRISCECGSMGCALYTCRGVSRRWGWSAGVGLLRSISSWCLKEKRHRCFQYNFNKTYFYLILTTCLDGYNCFKETKMLGSQWVPFWICWACGLE